MFILGEKRKQMIKVWQKLWIVKKVRFWNPWKTSFLISLRVNLQILESLLNFAFNMKRIYAI